MNQSFDARLQFYKGAVVGQVHDFSSNSGTHRVHLANKRPGIRSELLVAQGYSFLFAIVFEDLYGDLITDIEHFGRMINAAPREVRHMKQPIDAAQIDEYAVIRNVFHDAPHFGIFFENF